MKVVSRLFAALMAAALVVPAMAVPLMAAVDINSMNIRPSTSGPVGTEIYLEGEADYDDEGYVYFELDPEEDDWIEVTDAEDWDWDSFVVGTPPDEEEYYEYMTSEFEIPECIGGTHGIAIVEDDLGSSTDYDEVYDNRATTIKEFTVIPTIIVVSDDEGPAGTEVEVEGTGFGYEEDITIYFDGDEVDLVSSITANTRGSWSGSFVVPAASQGDHDITADGDYTDESDVDAATFTVTPGISVEPTSGKVGSEFVVKGSGFRESERDIEILFDSDSIKSGITANSNGTFEAVVVVPAAPMGTHEISAEGQYTTSGSIDEVEFEVEPVITIEPLEGNVGTEIQVSAAGLPSNAAVTVSYDGVTKGTGTTSSNGTLATITFSATHTQPTHAANHEVSVVFDSTTLTETFVMESTAPAKPTPRTPVDGTRIGLLGKQTPTLSWSVVDDPSGITYGLQISSTPDFSQILISKSGLVAQGSAIIVSSSGPEMTYTLSEAEALPFGTYYWKVKAIDGAMNDSGWTASSSFKSGLLPTWALIVIIVLAAVLVGALIYVLIIRDRVGLYD
ncbi:MAG: hypothetical protein JXA58_01015 [Dehalococcoidia bacterium]|nr:hypothetical protein [Dehalococcoidia bacterium]